MSNRLVVLAVALLVGAGVFVGASAIEDVLTRERGVGVSGTVVATNATVHQDRVGRPTAVGEVLNGLEEPIGDVRVTVTFHLTDGSQQAVTGRPALDPVPARGWAPFSVRLQDRTARAERVTVAVDYAPGAPAPYDGLAVVDDEVAGRSQSQLSLSGTVENRGAERVGAVVVVGFYDANGSVIGVRSVPTSPRVLAGGERGAFEIRFRTLGDVPSRAGDVDRYAIALRAEPADER